MQHEAIYALNPTVVRITGSGSDAIAYDANGNVVSWDASAVATKETELQAAEDLRQLRVERDRLLAETDWWMFSDTATPSQAQLDYRQALRDITASYSNLDDAVFPTKP
jgi:phosphoribosylformylglycinamidine (FGAM) synthase-like enzyme